jgi:hypothetical protein
MIGMAAVSPPVPVLVDRPFHSIFIHASNVNPVDAGALVFKDDATPNDM